MTSPLTDELTELLALGPRAAFVRRHRRAVTAAVVAVSVLTCAGLAALAGWHATIAHLERASWWFLPATFLAHVIAYAAYVAAHHEVVNRSRLTPVSWVRGGLMVVIGFGAWLIGGGFAVDRRALEWTGFRRADAGITAIALGGLELALLTPAAWVCALLLIGSPRVVDGATVPWVIGVPIGFGLALLGARAGVRRHLSDTATGWTRAWGELLVGLAAALALLGDRRRGPSAMVAIAGYWAADIAALWTALRMMSVTVGPAELIVAYATGYLLTRRTLPFAGIIVTEALMTVALIWVGVPAPAAVGAVLVYRLSDFALTLGAALVASSMAERRFLTAAERREVGRDSAAGAIVQTGPAGAVSGTADALGAPTGDHPTRSPGTPTIKEM